MEERSNSEGVDRPMLRVPITYAKPGMMLAMPIRHPQRPEHLLLQAGYELDQAAIGRLRELRLREVWIRYPNLEFIGKYINPHILEEQAKVGKAIGGALESVMRDATAKLPYPAFKSTIRDFIDKLLDDPQAAIFIEEISETDEPLLRHSCSVCFLSLLMGLKLEGYLVQQRRRLAAHRAKDVVNLGVGAMLHDVGMMRIDPKARQRWLESHDETDPAWREHVIVGYQLVQGHIEPSAAAAVLHHHQRYDGSGFPVRREDDGVLRGLVGERIHIFPRIVATADLFDRMRHPPDRSTPTPVVRALRRMQSPEIASRMDPMTYKALIAVTPPYPPGSLVTLSNGVRGVVIEWHPSDPCRPVVQALGDISEDHAKKGAAPDAERFDLRRDRKLHVVEAEGERVLEDNFYPKKVEEFAIDLDGRGFLAA